MFTVVSSNVMQRWSPDYDNGVEASCKSHLFFIFLFSIYITVVIKKFKFCLLVVLILLKIKYEHAEISAPKTGVLISITAYIKPCSCTSVETSISWKPNDKIFNLF